MSRVLRQQVRDSRPGEHYTVTVFADDPGVRHNPRTCIFAQCAVHHMRSPVAWVGYATAIFGLPLPGGEVEYVRFQTPSNVSDALRAYDKEGTPIPAGQYTFTALKPSARKRARAVRNAKRPGGRAVEPGSRPNTGLRSFGVNAPRGTYGATT